jgi:hypothetical protein
MPQNRKERSCCNQRVHPLTLHLQSNLSDNTVTKREML